MAANGNSEPEAMEESQENGDSTKSKCNYQLDTVSIQPCSETQLANQYCHCGGSLGRVSVGEGIFQRVSKDTATCVCTSIGVITGVGGGAGRLCPPPAIF